MKQHQVVPEQETDELSLRFQVIREKPEIREQEKVVEAGAEPNK